MRWTVAALFCTAWVHLGQASKVIMQPHPDSAKGLIRINKDGSYLYKTKYKDRTQANSFRGASFPKLGVTASEGFDFDQMYGSSSTLGFLAQFDVYPSKSWKSLGIGVELGVASRKASGFLGGSVRARENYNLYFVPVSLLASLRMDFSERQMFVPFLLGGATYWGLYERRDDGRESTLTGSGSLVGGGGLLIAVTRWDYQTGAHLQREFGIADMWLVLEARAYQGLKKDLDMTGSTFGAGVVVDY
jgi:hypothetical protein